MFNQNDIPPFRAGQIQLREPVLEAIRRISQRRFDFSHAESTTSTFVSAESHKPIREPIEVLNTESVLNSYSLFSNKRSSLLNYPWVSVRTESLKTEAGFINITNRDFTIQTNVAFDCETIGRLPVNLKFNPNDGPPKIGHPLGPNENGVLTIKRCGYVVLSEPDLVNNTVWVAKSNDQIVRVKLSQDIGRDQRGDGIILGEKNPQSQEECDGKRFKDPDKITADKPFILRRILNLAGRTIRQNDIHYAEPVLGTGYVIRDKLQKIYKAEAVDCFHPGTQGLFNLYVFNPPTGQSTCELSDWELLGQIIVCDVLERFFLLPGEWIDVQPTQGDPCNQISEVIWIPIGSYGLRRRGIVSGTLLCGQRGGIVILDHRFKNLQQTPCDGLISNCVVQACNGETGEEGRRAIFTNERVSLTFYESQWIIEPQPIHMLGIGYLVEDMCPDDEIGQFGDITPIDYCLGTVTSDIPNDSDNIFALSGEELKRGLLVRYVNTDGQQAVQRRLVGQLEHFCEEIAVTKKACQPPPDPQDPDPPEKNASGDHSFIVFEAEEGDCAIFGFTRDQTSIMSCRKKTKYRQIELFPHAVLANATLDLNEYCQLVLLGQVDAFCAFEAQEPDPPLISLANLQFPTTDVITEVQLEIDTGDEYSGSDLQVCANPVFKLKGKKGKAILCEDQDPYQQFEDLATLNLYEQTAYVTKQQTQDSEGIVCIQLVPFSFLVFAPCDQGTPETLICAKPCPPQSS